MNANGFVLALEICLPTPPALDWIVCGGESGPRARPCDPDWFRTVIRHGRLAQTAIFVKQLGTVAARSLGLASSKGADPSEWSDDLNVRQYPGGHRHD